MVAELKFRSVYLEIVRLPTEEALDDETILKLNILLNTSLNGLSINEISLAMITGLKKQAGEHEALVGDVIDAVAEAIKEDKDLEIYTSSSASSVVSILFLIRLPSTTITAMS